MPTPHILPDAAHSASHLAPRRIGRCNWIGVMTLIQKEVGRFMNVYLQTIIAPVLTLMMFFTVFSVSLQSHGVDTAAQGHAGVAFLAPGLLMMTMIQNAFANPSSSLIIAKVQGNIVDILMPPLAPWEILTGMMTGALLRSFMIGILGFFCLKLVIPLQILVWGHVLAYMVLGNTMLALIGILAGLWADKFDHMASITNFVITPLTFLSGTFYSLDALPPFWQGVALFNPFFYMIDGFRSGFTGIADVHAGYGAIILGGLDLILLLAAWVMLRTGYKTKF